VNPSSFIRTKNTRLGTFAREHEKQYQSAWKQAASDGKARRRIA
jgi:hypothetical protein